MRKIFKFFIMVLAILLLVGALGLYGLFTTRGSGFLARKFIDRWSGNYADVQVGKITGNMINGLRLSDLTLHNLKNFPAGSILEIKSLYINLSSPAVTGAVVEVENARLKLPASDSIFIFGSMRKGELDFNVYCNNIDTREVLGLFPKRPKSFQFVKGYITSADINVRGQYDKPELVGKFYVDKVFYKDSVLTQAPGQGQVRLERVNNEINLYGPVSFVKGEVVARNIPIHLVDSKVVFNGAPRNPVLNIYGYSTVEGLKINVRIEGPRESPKMELSSNPSYPEMKLLLMLATGKRWTGLDESISQGTISPGLARDAVDYFVFGGSGKRLGSSLGLKDVAISYDPEMGKKGVALKKDITQQIEVGYGVEQQQEQPGGASTVTQTLGGEIKMTDKLSVGVERELKRQYDPQLSSPDALPQETDDKVLLKYKRKF